MVKDKECQPVLIWQLTLELLFWRSIVNGELC